MNEYKFLRISSEEKEKAFVVNIMLTVVVAAATNEFIRTHAHVESGRGRFMRVRARARSFARSRFL